MYAPILAVFSRSVGPDPRAVMAALSLAVMAAVIAAGVAIGAAVAIDYDPAVDEAIVGAGATITSVGAVIQATSPDMPTPADSFTATSTSGRGGGNIGVAGSVAINVVNDTTEAIISPSATLAAGGGDVSLVANDTAAVTTSATPAVTARRRIGAAARARTLVRIDAQRLSHASHPCYCGPWPIPHPPA